MAKRKSITMKTRFEIFKRDNFTCQYCGKKTPEVILEIDHIIPVTKGGDSFIENLVTSCFECNRGKSGSLLNTILKNKDIHTETLLLAEREHQLAEYNFLKLKIREREDDEIRTLKRHFEKLFSYDDYYAGIAFDKIASFLRSALKVFSYIDILDIIEYAVRKTKNGSSDDYHNVAATKYLVAVLRNKMTGSNNG